MRHGTTGRRHRHRGGSNNSGGRRHNNNGGGHSRTQVFDSNGPDVRIRGTAYQVCEKYLALAKDAAAAGDRIMAENYLQHAEHYQRIIGTFEDSVRQQEGGFQRNFSAPQDAPDGNRSDDDLSLPVSILGGSPDVKSQDVSAVRASELASV